MAQEKLTIASPGPPLLKGGDMRNVIIATALVGILASLEVNAGVIAECGAFKGYAYYYLV